MHFLGKNGVGYDMNVGAVAEWARFHAVVLQS